MTRKEAQDLCLKWLEENMEKNDRTLDDICLMSPRIGKDSWTYREYKEAVVNDKPLCGLEDETSETPIDDILNFEKYKKERGENLLN